MQTLLTYVFLVIGFVFLVKGADWFVGGSSAVARLLHVPSIIIGLTIVAFGTSAPELAVSLTAALSGSNDIAIGNVVGSNFFNLLMVVGICALIKPMQIQENILKKEFPFSIICGIVLLILSLNFGQGYTIGHMDGLILLAIFVFFVSMQIKSALKAKKASGHTIMVESPEIKAAELHDDTPDRMMPPFMSVLLIIVGLALVVIGGDMVVDSATEIARSLGLSEAFIGLTVVAFGTSLPELVTSIVASKKGENELALGNVIGSNIFNILLIIGASAAITPMNVAFSSIIDLILLTVVSIITLVIAWRGKNINRIEGGIMVAMYLTYVGYLLSQI